MLTKPQPTAALYMPLRLRQTRSNRETRPRQLKITAYIVDVRANYSIYHHHHV